MARPKKNTDEFIDEVQEDAPIEVITDEKIKHYNREINAKQADLDEFRGQVGNLYKQFSEDGGNNKAFKLALKIGKMDEIGRSDFLRSLDRYLNVLGVYDQQDMYDPLPSFAGAPVEADPAIIH